MRTVAIQSQSPRFGSRCFVTHDEVLQSLLHKTRHVAIPSVRVSVFRPKVEDPAWNSSRGARRNPLGSGLGVSSWAEEPPYHSSSTHCVAIPSVRVSVFRP